MMLTNGGRKVGRANRGVTGGAYQFSSNWATATGTTDSAIGDGGKWNTFWCTIADVLSVIAGSDIGWTRTANVLRVKVAGGTCGGIERTAAVPVSTSHYGRFFFRNDEPSGTHNHPVTYNHVGAIQLVPWARQGNGATTNFFMRTYYTAAGGSTSYPTNSWSPHSSQWLSTGVWYRFEWHMEYITATTYRVHPRIYNMAGTLLHDENSYYQSDAALGSGLTLKAFYDAPNSFGFSDVNLATRVGVGNEGSTGNPADGDHWYHAEYALSLTGWIGDAAS